MQKKILVVLMFILLGICSVGCNPKIKSADEKKISSKSADLSKEENVKNDEIKENDKERNNSNKSLSYNNVKSLIERYMMDFSNKITNTVLSIDDDTSKIVSCPGSIDLSSTEGNEVKRYEDSNDGVIRYSINILGELGGTKYDYYKINDELIYVTEENVIYSYPMNLGFDIDVLRTLMNEYVISDNVIYYMNNYENELVEIKKEHNKLPYTNFEELNMSFIKTNE